MTFYAGLDVSDSERWRTAGGSLREPRMCVWLTLRVGWFAVMWWQPTRTCWRSG